MPLKYPLNHPVVCPCEGTPVFNKSKKASFFTTVGIRGCYFSWAAEDKTGVQEEAIYYLKIYIHLFLNPRRTFEQWDAYTTTSGAGGKHHQALHLNYYFSSSPFYSAAPPPSPIPFLLLLSPHLLLSTEANLFVAHVMGLGCSFAAPRQLEQRFYQHFLTSLSSIKSWRLRITADLLFYRWVSCGPKTDRTCLRYQDGAAAIVTGTQTAYWRIFSYCFLAFKSPDFQMGRDALGTKSLTKALFWICSLLPTQW